ncbi:putative sporulation protein YtxC [Cohnella xylanilytica]|uniref:Putative sporulation protein YtxC n=1 Tax=Cohnella xylanilytica TaxID=557555 RepID=A0A841TXC1_9BACL|nr:putative sporulation protein YtxC [Cohnella xylanilytica]MBB6691672.1 putative sporulation protein YtxC [Cohnella xylanilytica]
MKRDEWTIDAGGDRDSAARLTALLNQPFAGLTGRGGEGPWELSEADGRIRCALTIETGREDFCAKTGAALSEYIVAEREPALLRRLIRHPIGLKADNVEADVLVSEAIGLLDGEPEPGSEALSAGRGRERRIRKWGQLFAAYLMEHEYLHVEGFIRFRLKDYEAEVREAAEAAVEERLMERQYQEFVTLLQSMVEWQEVRVPAVHVLHSGGHAFRLLDDKMRPLEKDAEAHEAPRPADGNVLDEQEEESLLVSRLLAASPRHLYIHTAEPDAQVIRTLLGIFGERAALCPDVPK